VLVETIRWAASNGDRSENGDYIYGKKRLREIDRRIRFLLKRLESATVVAPADQENVEQVFFGATVTFVCDVDSEIESDLPDRRCG
jgi:transcription elongation factor GreB